MTSGETALVLLAGDTELEKSLLQMIGQHGLAEQVGSGSIVVQARRFLAQVVPLVNAAVSAGRR